MTIVICACGKSFENSRSFRGSRCATCKGKTVRANRAKIGKCVRCGRKLVDGCFTCRVRPRKPRAKQINGSLKILFGPMKVFDSELIDLKIKASKILKNPAYVAMLTNSEFVALRKIYCEYMTVKEILKEMGYSRDRLFIIEKVAGNKYVKAFGQLTI